MGIPLISSTNEGYQAALSGNLVKKTSEPTLRLAHKPQSKPELDPEKLGRCARAKAEVWAVERELDRFGTDDHGVSCTRMLSNYTATRFDQDRFKEIRSGCRTLLGRVEAALDAIEKNCTQPFRAR